MTHHPVMDLVGSAAARAASWMTEQAVLAHERDAGTLADLRRIGAPEDMLRAGDQLHVGLHRLAAELGQPSVVPKWPRPLGLASAAADVAGAELLLAGSLARWWTFILDDAVRGASARAAAEQKAAAAPPPAGSPEPIITRLQDRRR